MTNKCAFKCQGPNNPSKIRKGGHYYRTSDRKWVQRYKCALCKRSFSASFFTPCYRQKKRHLNNKIMLNLISGVSQRRTALTMKINLKTVARKLLFLANKARITNMKIRSRVSGIEAFQFDDLETFVHTKLKPLSVVLAVEKRSRHMLGFEVAQMPAKGLLAEKSVKKYGKRMDQRAEARDRLFCRIQNQILPGALIESDDNPHYPASVKAYFPSCIHKTYLGGRSAVTAQGELKKVIQDPLFSLNHTCAMNRYSISRLIRKTWCTTKRIFALADHLEIYMYFHNRYLIKRTAPQKFIQGSC